MDAWRFVLSSLRHYRRIHFAVALGVAVATAVLTGALLVGDSVRGSLRDLTLERLGRIDSVIVAGHPFRAILADELAADPEFAKHFASAEPALLLTGTLEAGNGKTVKRATGVSLVGFAPGFWTLGEGGPAKSLAGDEVALTEPVANELGVKVGGNVLVRVPVQGAIPADSTLGEKSDTSRSRSMNVGAILPVEGLARFGIVPSQQLPRTAFVPLAAMQSVIRQPEKANAILVATNDVDRAAGDDAERSLEKLLRPTLADYGVRAETLTRPHSVQISADSLVLPDGVVRAIEKASSNGGEQPVITYLANTIAAGEGSKRRKIPYSTITGVESTAELGPLLDKDGKPLAVVDDEIVLNRWAADELNANVGDAITVTYYEPESTHGKLHAHDPPPVFKLKAIVELKRADGKPTLAADRKLTPELPGVTDQKSIRDWDLPFELVEKIRPQDEDYWDDYGTTPKAFVSLAKAKKLWASRWGAISLIRLPLQSTATPEKLAAAIERQISPAAMGVTLLPVKAQGLAASAGTTPFEGLFLGFSFFLIAAAVMLIALLFQLGIEQRAAELGTLAAVGIGRKRMTRLLAREGLLVAAVGATVGVVAGVLYAWLMTYGLRTWWLAAISTPFLRLHVSWLSLLIGWVAGIAVAWLTIRWSIRRLVRQPVNRLLAGVVNTTSSEAKRGARWSRWLAWPTLRIVLAVLALLQCAGGFFLHGEAQAGIFFGSGAAMLALLLGEIRYRLRNVGRESSFEKSFSLAGLSLLNTSRNPGRSTLTIGLVAAASFLIVAVSAFRLNTGEGGTGGFEYVATSDLPLHFDLNTAEGRREFGFSDTASKELEDWRFFAFRVANGENASCLNLYQPKQPRVLGVPASLVERGGFAWAGATKGFGDKPWHALGEELGKDESGRAIVPVVLDKSTAVYSLHLGGVGSRLTIHDAADQPVELQVVGLLENSVLQGNVLMSEANFLKVFPDTAGYRYFLIESNRHAPHAVVADAGGDGEKESADGMRSMPATLESTLAQEGFDVADAHEQLGQFLAVQNTYLSTFQSLGGLGLLLGTIGLAIVQLRSVLERRGELALMRAGGFRRSRLVWMVICENGVLLLGGLLAGGIAAVVALIPQWMPHRASVPWGTLAILLGTIAVVGMLAGWLATRRTLRAPIVGALRGD